MVLVDYLMAYLKKAKPEMEKTTSVDTCSVCWGYQAFDKNVRTISKNKDMDVKNHKDSYMKLQKFMVDHVEGAKTRKVRSRPFRREKEI